jgi:hypothetical protein
VVDRGAEPIRTAAVSTGAFPGFCPSGSLCRELVVEARSRVERAVENADEPVRLLPATMDAEDELVQGALEVSGADAVEGPAELGATPREARDSQQQDTPQ